MDSSTSITSEYQLGPFKIKGSQNLVIHNDEDIVVLPKVMSLLLHFCKNSGKVITFDELNDAIWPNEVVGDNAIYNLVGQLRKVLGDSASQPTYIQTISKVGYKLLLDATPIENIEVVKPVVSVESAQPRKKTSITKWLIPFILIVSFTTIFSTQKSNESPEALSAQAQSQLQLAYYQLYRGDSEGVTQAIETLQELIALEPSLVTPKIDLAYSFVRMARIDPQQAEFWLEKARALSVNEQLKNQRARLLLTVDAMAGTPLNINAHESHYSAPNILNSERLAYSDVLFDAGHTEQALTQAQQVLDNCLDCPYVYRKVAAIQVVLGRIKEGFDNFSHYRKLLNKPQGDPVHTAGYVPLTLSSVNAMAKWHSKAKPTVELLDHQRNTLALFYLTLEKVDEAEALLPLDIKDSDSFFDLYTLAAIAGAKGDFETSFRFLDKRQTLYPDNTRFKLSVVYALWQLGKHQDALSQFEAWELIPPYDTLPDSLPFSEWAMYAALLMNTGNKVQGEAILSTLEQQLRSGIVSGSHSSDVRLASVLSLQGKTDEAIKALHLAIAQGWVSDFNQNWWYLENSPFFAPLKAHPEFKVLVKSYHQQFEQLNAKLSNETEGE